MKQVILVAIIIAVVVVLACVVPASVINMIIACLCIGTVIAIIVGLIYMIIAMEVSERKERRERKAKNEHHLYMIRTYGRLTDGMSYWLDADTLLNVTWSEYSETYLVEYCTGWSRKCIKTIVHIDGTIDDEFTVGGCTLEFENDVHRNIYYEAIDILCNKLNNINK